MPDYSSPTFCGPSGAAFSYPKGEDRDMRIIDALIAWPVWVTAWAARHHRENQIWRVMRDQNRRAGK